MTAIVDPGSPSSSGVVIRKATCCRLYVTLLNLLAEWVFLALV